MDLFSIWHWLIVAVIVLLLFGKTKISDAMGDFAQGIKAFKKGMAEDDRPVQNHADGAKAIDRSNGGEGQSSETMRRTEGMGA